MATISQRSRSHSAACWAFRTLYPELKTGIRHDLESLNAQLYGDGLICKDTRDKANAKATLDEVEDNLGSDESVFEAFISVLAETSCGDTLVKKLREKRRGNLTRQTDCGAVDVAEDPAAPSRLQFVRPRKTTSEQLVSTVINLSVDRSLLCS